MHDTPRPLPFDRVSFIVQWYRQALLSLEVNFLFHVSISDSVGHFVVRKRQQLVGMVIVRTTGAFSNTFGHGFGTFRM